REIGLRVASSWIDPVELHGRRHADPATSRKIFRKVCVRWAILASSATPRDSFCDLWSSSERLQRVGLGLCSQPPSVHLFCWVVADQIGGAGTSHYQHSSVCSRTLHAQTKARSDLSDHFARRARRIGFGATRFHDLRGVHTTALLDALIPV